MQETEPTASEPEQLKPLEIQSVGHVVYYDRPPEMPTAPIVAHLTPEEYRATHGCANPDVWGGALDEEEEAATRDFMAKYPGTTIERPDAWHPLVPKALSRSTGDF